MSESVSTSARPVFIAGCGRSGTSLLRTLIDAHPDVYIPSESLFIVDYLRDGANLPPWLFRRLIYNEPQLLCWYEADPVSAKSVPDTLVSIHVRMATGTGARVWGQKTPRFVRYRTLIDRAFPGCRWLLVYRDPRAVCASMRQSSQHTSSTVAACRRWKRDNRDVVKFLHQPGCCPDNVRLIKYEDLIAHSDATMTSIFRFLELESIPVSTLAERARPVFFSKSRFANNTIRDGVIPDSTRINEWKSALTPGDIAYIEASCATEMAILGYENTGCRPDRWFRFVDFARRLRDAGIVYRYLRYWPSYPLYTVYRKIVLAIFRWRKD